MTPGSWTLDALFAPSGWQLFLQEAWQRRPWLVARDDRDFFSALATSATGRTRSTVAKAPVRLPKDAFLVLTRKGAADSAVGILDVLVDAVLQGAA